MRMKPIAAAGLLLGLAGCGPANAPAPPEAGASPAGEALPALPPGAPADFAVCTTCHSATAGRNGVGPGLFGVVGRRAGTLAGYPYSAALRKSGIVWTPARLDLWLSGPMTLVPGTKMSFGGYSDSRQRQAVIAYLTTLK